MESALPNKVMEYIACGLPLLAFPHKTIKNFVEKYEVGLIFRNLDEMVTKLEDKELTNRIRRNVSELRHKFTVEKNIGRVVDFYNKILT